MLTDTVLKNSKSKDKTYKVSDRDGMYALLKTTGAIVSRLDDVGGQAFFIIMAPRPLALRRAMLSEHPADPALGQL